MIVKIKNRFGIELETTKEIAELMVKRWEISSYETPEGDEVTGTREVITPEIDTPKTRVRKIKSV